MISSDKYLCNMYIYICTQQQKLRVIEQGKHISSSLLTCKVHNPQSITTFNNTLHSVKQQCAVALSSIRINSWTTAPAYGTTYGARISSLCLWPFTVPFLNTFCASIVRDTGTNHNRPSARLIVLRYATLLESFISLSPSCLENHP